jgi:hypothetical protein
VCGEPEKSHEKTQDSRYWGRDLNPGPLEYDREVLSLYHYNARHLS